MVAALEQAWAAIRSRHPDVPAAVIVLGAGSVGTPEGMLRLGHFAAMRWRADADGAELLAEVFVGGVVLTATLIRRAGWPASGRRMTA